MLGQDGLDQGSIQGETWSENFQFPKPIYMYTEDNILGYKSFYNS